jgi:predicted esterase
MSQSEEITPSKTDTAFKAVSGYEHFRRVWMVVYGDLEFAGKSIEVREGERLMGEAQLLVEGETSSARLELPMPPIGKSYGSLTFWIEGECVGLTELPDADEERLKALESVELHFSPYVFWGTEFPECEFEQPSLVEDLIGRHTIRTTFYDRDFQPVDSAESVGRYGAVIEIEAEDGRVFKRFQTLFRKPDPAHGRRYKPRRPQTRMNHPMPIWYGKAGPFPLPLPGDMGIDPEVVREQGTTLVEYLRGTLEYAYWDDPWFPILLAGLHETAPGDGDLRRNSAWERDRRWWVELKRRTGDLHLPHLIYLPQEYDADPSRRWPLVLFLHGSYEIGDDLNKVREAGLAKLAEKGQNFPFILVAPQSPKDDWFWSPYALNALLDEVVHRYRVDEDRIVVTGLSMGGRGTWVLAIEYPDRFAAIAPICGSIPEPGEAKRITEVPVWAFVGAKDDDQSIQQFVDALREAGGNVRLTVYPDANHDAWTPTYAAPAFFEWLLRHRRTSRPEKS